MSDSVFVMICISAFAVIVILHKIMHTRHPFRSGMLSVLGGIAALTVVNLCSSLTAVSIPVSRLSLGVSSFLGIPGVICMLLLPMIWQ